jgi:hypothetical protein
MPPETLQKLRFGPQSGQADFLNWPGSPNPIAFDGLGDSGQIQAARSSGPSQTFSSSDEYAALKHA